MIWPWGALEVGRRVRIYIYIRFYGTLNLIAMERIRVLVLHHESQEPVLHDTIAGDPVCLSNGILEQWYDVMCGMSQ